jgi:hypothetical protein
VGLFFEVILVAAITWLLARFALQWRRERRMARATTGLHDAGVWVNERTWMGIVTGLESEQRPGDPSARSAPGQAEQPGQASKSERLGHDE